MASGTWAIHATGTLLTDLYQLTMFQACLEQGMTDTAVFELFVRWLTCGNLFAIVVRTPRGHGHCLPIRRPIGSRP
jgi:nicotinic acid phosphoribosyltransferase